MSEETGKISIGRIIFFLAVLGVTGFVLSCTVMLP